MHLGVCLKNQGKFKEAEQLLYDSLKITLDSPNGGIEHLATAEASFAFAVLSVQMGRICKGVFLFKLAERGLVKALGEQHQHTRDTMWRTKRSFELMIDYGKIPVLKEMSDMMNEMASVSVKFLRNLYFRNKNTPYINPCVVKNLEVVKTLLAAGVEVDKADGDGKTPLYQASCMGHVEVVKTLLAAEAEVDKANGEGDTPLHWASSFSFNDQEHVHYGVKWN